MIKEYNPQVEVLRYTMNPAELVALACSINMKGKFKIPETEGTDRTSLMKYLYEAEHGAPLEHPCITFNVTNVSRACADQVRTHRMSSVSMSSTHYQDHEGYDMLTMDTMANNSEVKEVMTRSKKLYSSLRAKEEAEARQILPLATEACFMWSIDARSLAHFLRVRMCERNMLEMTMLARLIHTNACNWFPELFNHVGRPCTFGKCNQGRMSCQR